METGRSGSCEGFLSVITARRGLPPNLRFLGFVGAGGVATSLNYLLFLALLTQQVPYLWAAGIGYLSGIVVSFLLNRFVVFASKERAPGEILRYLAAYLMAFVAQLMLLEALVRADVRATVANAAAIGFVVIINFFVVRRLVFDRTAKQPST
jgi:putative flippase GtrA